MSFNLYIDLSVLNQTNAIKLSAKWFANAFIGRLNESVNVFKQFWPHLSSKVSSKLTYKSWFVSLNQTSTTIYYV